MRTKTVSAVALAIGAMMVSAASAQVGEYYLVRAEQGHIWVIQGGVVVREWNVDGDLEIPLTVTDTVRTYGYRNGDIGSEYELDGTLTGVHYPWAPDCGQSYLDGATDGEFAYAVQYTGARPICRYDLDWTNPQLLFNLPANEQWDAITYDPDNGTMWATGRNNVLAEFQMNGTEVQRFTIPAGGRSAGLALDPADDTFWMHRGGDIIQQYDKNGQLLTTHNVPGVSGNIWGGEFQFGGGGRCQYTIRSSKAKGGCETCPSKGDNFETQQPCEEVTDCRKKVKTTITCPEGPGACKIKAKRSSCD